MNIFDSILFYGSAAIFFGSLFAAVKLAKWITGYTPGSLGVVWHNLTADDVTKADVDNCIASLELE